MALSGSPRVSAMARFVCRWCPLMAAATLTPIPPTRTMLDKKMSALPRQRIAPSCIARSRNPAPCEIEGEAEIDQSGRYPHHKACELLVLERRKPADCSELALLRIPGLAREGQENAKHRAVQAGEEQASDSDAVTTLAQWPVEQRPPKQDRAEEEARMLQTVHRDVGQYRIVENRHVPGPQRNSVDDGRHKWVAQHAPWGCDD